MQKSLFLVLAVALASLAAHAATVTLYVDKAAFDASLALPFTDDYTNPGYQTAGTGTGPWYLTDAEMSGVMRQTRYQALTVSFSNIVIPGSPYLYCAGCNGAFLLDFTATTAGQDGVNAAGFDYIAQRRPDIPELDVIATFLDSSTQTFALTRSGFFGLTSTSRITSFAVGMSNGQPMIGGSDSSGHSNAIKISNLTIDPLPEPGTWFLTAGALGGLGLWRRRRLR